MRILLRHKKDFSAIHAQMKALVEAADSDHGGVLDEEAQAKFDALKERRAEVEAAIARRQELLEIDQQLERRDDSGHTATLDPELLQMDRANEEASKKKNRFNTFGEYLQAVHRACRSGGTLDPRLVPVGAATGLSEGIPSEGGFLVQKDFETEVFRLMHETGVLWGRCRNIPISTSANGVKIPAINETSRATGSRLGGIRGYWMSEGQTKTASKPDFRQVSLDLKKWIGLCYATDELLQDAAALEAVLMQGFAEELGFQLDDSLINGTGAGQPVGLLNAVCTVSVAKETGQVAATILAENVEKMYSRMWSRSVGNASWLINQDCWPQIFQLHHAVGTGGVPMFVPAGGLTQSPFGTLLGRPIVPIEQCATLGTVGDIIFADFSQYVTATKGGIQSASSIHVQFTTDETVYRWVYRADGQPIWNAALTPASGSGNTQSPFITLATRA